MAAASTPSPPHPSLADPEPEDDAIDSSAGDATVETKAAETAVDSNAADTAPADSVSTDSAAADTEAADSAADNTEAVDSAAADVTVVADSAATEANASDAAAAVPEATPLPVIRMKPPPSSWTHQETLTVVQAYGERWYANKRRPLRGSQWEEIAALVASRGGSRGVGQQPKTPIQCRHKIDKLRKRFRAERLRGGSWNWQYYELMSRLERGPNPPVQARPAVAPAPAPAPPPAPLPVPTSRYRVRVDASNGFAGNLVEILEDGGGGGMIEEEEEDEDDENHCNKSRSINYILRRPAMVNRFPGDMSLDGGGANGVGVSAFSVNPPLKRTREEIEAEAAAEREKLVAERERRRVITELASEIRSFAESYVGMENVKMEMMREGEKRRMEMESRRMEMILDSQKKIAETIADAFSRMYQNQKDAKKKMSQET